MPLSYIISQVSSKMGLDSSYQNQRATILRLVNEAAKELYTQGDPPGSLMEQVFKLNGDQTITLPSYVGLIRGARELQSMQTWHVNQMRPRYNQFNWTDMWRNYRLKEKQALMCSVINMSVGLVGVPKIEDPPVIVSLTGPTPLANQITETITLDSSCEQEVFTEPISGSQTTFYFKSSINAFSDYIAFKKNIVNQVNVTLMDVDGRVLSVIQNNELEAQYQLLDVSACPWLPQNTSQFDNYMELLFKKKLPYFSNDGDEFPAFEYDDVIVNKVLQLWFEEQGKTELATAYDAKATRTAARIKMDHNKDTEDMVSLVQNPHDTMLKRVGTGLRRRYSLYAGRKF